MTLQFNFNINTTEKKLIAVVILVLKGGQATTAGKVSLSLGSWRVNTTSFIKEYNQETKNMIGITVPARIRIYEDRSFLFNLKTPPTSELLLEFSGLKKGSSKSAKETLGSINKKNLEAIAEKKLPDLNTKNIDVAGKIILGTSKNMGIILKDNSPLLIRGGADHRMFNNDNENDALNKLINFERSIDRSDNFKSQQILIEEEEKAYNYKKTLENRELTNAMLALFFAGVGGMSVPYLIASFIPLGAPVVLPSIVVPTLPLLYDKSKEFAPALFNKAKVAAPILADNTKQITPYISKKIDLFSIAKKVSGYFKKAKPTTSSIIRTGSRNIETPLVLQKFSLSKLNPFRNTKALFKSTANIIKNIKFDINKYFCKLIEDMPVKYKSFGEPINKTPLLIRGGMENHDRFEVPFIPFDSDDYDEKPLNFEVTKKLLIDNNYDPAIYYGLPESFFIKLEREEFVNGLINTIGTYISGCVTGIGMCCIIGSMFPQILLKLFSNLG